MREQIPVGELGNSDELRDEMTALLMEGLGYDEPKARDFANVAILLVLNHVRICIRQKSAKQED